MTIRPTALLALLLPLCACVSQKLAYQPAAPDSISNYLEAITQRKAADFSGAYHKDAQKILKERKESFLTSIKDSTYIFDQKIGNYFKGIVAEIYRGNPQIDHRDFYFFIDKSPVPNAGCYGNGIFTLNLGLFDVLHSDDEMAFTICHEMAHYVLKHNDKSLRERLEKINSKETKKQIRVAANKNYGARRALMDVAKNLSYNFMRHSRSAEMQADSLGLELLRHTRYNPAAAYVSLEKLGKCDTLIFTADTKIRKRFDFADFPFQENWLERDVTLFDLKKEADDYALDEDSLKTHPDIPQRLLKLAVQYPQHGAVSASPGFEDIRKAVIADNIVISIDASRLDMALYQTMVYFDQGWLDEKTYAQTVAGLLQRAYQLKSAHAFGKYVSEPGTFSSEKYLDEIKLFLVNIELKPLRRIGLRFCRQNAALMAGDARFTAISDYFEKLNTN